MTKTGEEGNEKKFGFLVIMAAVGCIMVIVKYSGHPGVTNVGLSREAGSIAMTAVIRYMCWYHSLLL